jgi:hypothetical protein
MVKAASAPIGQANVVIDEGTIIAGDAAKTESVVPESYFTFERGNSMKTTGTANAGKASDFYKKLNTEWDGSMYQVEPGYSRTDFYTNNGSRVTLNSASKSTPGANVKIVDNPGYQLILRFPEF